MVKKDTLIFNLSNQWLNGTLRKNREDFGEEQVSIDYWEAELGHVCFEMWVRHTRCDGAISKSRGCKEFRNGAIIWKTSVCVRFLSHGNSWDNWSVGKEGKKVEETPPRAFQHVEVLERRMNCKVDCTWGRGSWIGLPLLSTLLLSQTGNPLQFMKCWGLEG